MKLIKNFIGFDGFQWWIGVVEDRNDPEKIGRCRVRIFGVHSEETSLIPTEDLPWAVPVYSVNNSDTFSAPKEGEYVIGFFLDGSFCQAPAILGILPGFNRQNPPAGHGFGDLRDADKIRNSPRKPTAIDYPEARSGHPTAITGNIINDGLGVAKVAADNIVLHVPLSLTARASLTDDNQNVIGYNHKLTQRELNQGYISLNNGEVISINGYNGANTQITKTQAKVLLDTDIIDTIKRAKDSIGEDTWNKLNVPQKAGLVLNAYHLGTKVDFEKSGVRTAVSNGDVIRAAQLLSAEMLKSSTGKYLKSEDSLAHIAASLFKSIPRSELAAARANTITEVNPLGVSGAGVGVQVHESNISDDNDAESLKYPSPEEINKASLSDLVTAADKTLIQKFRERSPISVIGANNESWSEPAPAYSAEYPHNKARETESGHIFEMDDTPLNERIHLAHRSGSFVEWYPSGTKVEKVVKNNYRIVMSDDHLYVAGKVNIVLESNANIRVVGDCFLQVENNVDAKVSGNLNFSVGDSFNVKANSMNIDVAQTSSILANTQYVTSSNTLNLRSNSTLIKGNTVEVDGLLNAGNTNLGTTAFDIANSSIGGSITVSVAGEGGLPAAAGVSANLDEPTKKGTATAAQKFLEYDRVVKLSDEINEENNRNLRNYLANPYNFPSTYKNVKRYIGISPKSGSDLIYRNTVGESLIIINETADISKWMDKQLFLASNGYWRESGFELTGKIQPSNPNITDLWRNLGFTREFWTLSDQTPWAMAFVNFGLKQNGYRYVQTPHPKDLEIRLEDYRFTRVRPEDAQPGDVVLWANDHVNFVYRNNNGALTFLGGSQPPASILDIGDGRIGDVSIVTDGGCPIITILRPSKT